MEVILAQPAPAAQSVLVHYYVTPPLFEAFSSDLQAAPIRHLAVRFGWGTGVQRPG
jgi:hypothetical protein